ncbi:ArsA family ATPase [Calidifontibacter sp. DB0510]|uniref:ArsA family ATPase n=1 Tax=Metallococcus carri TaxID=1656884 RepID=A0A967B2I8_9MICO|nr:ArsA-related P-loop ATPase [Metallococcus carri]NHN56827.1 ArsA family ATPase [Metallococcus carri]NOP37796.1 ArsA family ATPase [Calidifontibacter sp. DB2511S]
MTDLQIGALIDDPNLRTIVCCGAGGVGKTTTAAAIAVRAAESGRSVAVLTIDPAKRLAQAIGLEQLGNEPAQVTAIDPANGGRLDAMMLDMKRTFDEVVLRHAEPAKAQQILANPFYQAVSSSFAGTQEYMAMERLGQLHAERAADGSPRWDLIVVDTPPSRSALDFLDAPQRLGSFLDGKVIRLLGAPARRGGRAYLKAVNVGVSSVTAVMSKIIGGDMLRDAQAFVAALDTMFGGFRERADATYALLADRSTAFVVVATPERDALREAAFFVDRLDQDGMPLAGVVLNRVQMTYVPSLSAGRALAAAETLTEQAGRPRGWQPSDTADLLTLHATVTELGIRHAQLIESFSASHPDIATVQVAAASHDVSDVADLRQMGAELAG